MGTLLHSGVGIAQLPERTHRPRRVVHCPAKPDAPSFDNALIASFTANLVTGNLNSLIIPCSIPVPIRRKNGVFPPKYSLPGTYLLGVATEGPRFPVFFPVSKEFARRRVRAGLHPPPSS